MSDIKRLTKTQWRAVYNATYKSYHNSHASMVDDGMRGFQTRADVYDLGTFYDGSVFQFIMGKVRAHRQLGGDDYDTLEQLRKEDIV